MGLLFLFAKGLAVGFAVAAPVGPIGVLCVQRTIADGRLTGLLTGLGAATADAAYGAIAAFGVAAVADFLANHGVWVRGIGGAILLVLAVRTFRSPPARAAAPLRGTALLGAYGSTFVLTMANPTTVLSFIAIFAAVGIGTAGGELMRGTVLVAGVFLGSAVWWLGLSAAVATIRHAVETDTMRGINKFSGALIGVFGLGALLSTLL